MHDIQTQLREYLATFQGKPIYMVPMVGPDGVDFGNNGDDLIEIGGAKLMRELNLQFCSEPEQADVLFIRGNGAMVQRFRLARNVLQNVWDNFPTKPLVMLPATFYYPKMGFTEGFKSREAPVTLFCREQYSWRHLKEDHQLPKYCSIGLDHDTAFELQDDPLVTNRLNRPPKHVLICERGDLEHPTNSAGFWEDPTKPVRRSLKTKLVRNIPVAIKKPFYPLKAMARSRKATPFRRYCEQKIQDEWKQFKDLPHLRCDVSDRSLGSFDEFCDRIADSAVVFSTRLHVGIFAAMLGKPTYIFEGPYHKIRAIYEHSMADLAHVNFVSRDDLR